MKSGRQPQRADRPRAIPKSITACDITGEGAHLKRFTAERVQRAVWRILAETPLCAIATVTPDGRVHINTAYFAYSATLEVYFLSHPTSRHSKNLRARSKVAIAVFDSAQIWGKLDRGLQLFGTCREARGMVVRAAEQLYAQRFKAYARWKAELHQENAARDYRFYRFVTRRVKLLDEREFGSAVFVTATIARAR